MPTNDPLLGSGIISMDEKQTFLERFERGWQSVVGPALQPPEI
jgi:hypothetical protein